MRTAYGVSECVGVIAAEIKDACDRPRREAELMVMERLGKDQLWLLTHADDEMEFDTVLQEWVRRRRAHEPLEYIFNRVSFYSQQFYIAPGGLIPRPETELLIDRVVEAADAEAALRVCEVGVGSGAVSVVLAQQLPQASIIGVDISPEALNVACKNVEGFGLEARIELRASDLLGAVEEKIDILVSNPPYIARDAELERNLDYEPEQALFGGEKGDEIISRLIDAAYERHIPLFCCEMGYDQRAAVTKMLEGRAYRSLEFYKDLAGLDRGFVLKL